MLTPIRNGILFVFTDTLKGKFFQETTDWGLNIVGGHENTAKAGRWGKVLAVGPEVDHEDVTSGTYIFIEPLMWTVGFKHDGVQIWKTDITKVLAVSEQLPK